MHFFNVCIVFSNVFRSSLCALYSYSIPSVIRENVKKGTKRAVWIVDIFFFSIFNVRNRRQRFRVFFSFSASSRSVLNAKWQSAPLLNRIREIIRRLSIPITAAIVSTASIKCLQRCKCYGWTIIVPRVFLCSPFSIRYSFHWTTHQYEFIALSSGAEMRFMSKCTTIDYNLFSGEFFSSTFHKLLHVQFNIQSNDAQRAAKHPWNRIDRLNFLYVQL